MENSRYLEVFHFNYYRINTLALLMYVSQSNRHSEVTDWVPGPSYLRLKKKNIHSHEIDEISTDFEADLSYLVS